MTYHFDPGMNRPEGKYAFSVADEDQRFSGYFSVAYTPASSHAV